MCWSNVILQVTIGVRESKVAKVLCMAIMGSFDGDMVFIHKGSLEYMSAKERGSEFDLLITLAVSGVRV